MQEERRGEVVLRKYMRACSILAGEAIPELLAQSPKSATSGGSAWC